MKCSQGSKKKAAGKTATTPTHEAPTTLSGTLFLSFFLFPPPFMTQLSCFFRSVVVASALDSTRCSSRAFKRSTRGRSPRQYTCHETSPWPGSRIVRLPLFRSDPRFLLPLLFIPSRNLTFKCTARKASERRMQNGPQWEPPHIVSYRKSSSSNASWEMQLGVFKSVSPKGSLACVKAMMVSL